MDIVSPAVLELMKQGTGWLVAILIGVYAWILDGRLRQQQIDTDKQAELANKAVQDQYEKRLAEFREILDAMVNSTATVNALKGSLTPVTDAINQMVVGLAKLLNEFQSQNVRWDDRGASMLKQLEDLRVRLENIQRGVAA